MALIKHANNKIILSNFYEFNILVSFEYVLSKIVKYRLMIQNVNKLIFCHVSV